MQMRLQRTPSLQGATLGLLRVETHEFPTLEDQLRTGPKVPGETAIPAGRYQVILKKSPRFGRDLPTLVDVPGFTDILIHGGNTKADTHGCILVGLNVLSPTSIGTCEPALTAVIGFVRAATRRGERTYIEVSDPPAAIATPVPEQPIQPPETTVVAPEPAPRPDTPLVTVRYQAMNTFVEKLIGSFVRNSIMVPVCGYLVLHKAIDGEQADQWTSSVVAAAVGAGGLLLTQGWSWWQKYSSSKREMAIHSLPEHSSEQEIRAKMLELGVSDLLKLAQRRLPPEDAARLKRLEDLMIAVQARLEELQPRPPGG